MNYTSTITSKGQVTIPRAVRQRLGLKSGVKVDIYPTQDGFIGRPRRKSRILELLGDLKHLDHGESFREIREKTHELAAREIVKSMKAK